ncbi:hypothetical protein TNIN_7261 [Trichonephila inaurata madagascariensis]|uniref:Uncharacterized protein n=1 Tax=Trichonephila inaurata madagascariensis TaxID=2747483 RepID=A0A8X6I4N5_9ARAC|nr:hypothetical protein TNIN_7261 [Trichonephila inaurata madagascariensis]
MPRPVENEVSPKPPRPTQDPLKGHRTWSPSKAVAASRGPPLGPRARPSARIGGIVPGKCIQDPFCPKPHPGRVNIKGPYLSTKGAALTSLKTGPIPFDTAKRL